ncbi:alpha/beta fold hydrolase [Streptosporangiaceae bacterium NEAU-GS5]|nr:alpha/beta fold hydrolase [Streptosporangiaceae bacterium NEAU-GS5]
MRPDGFFSSARTAHGLSYVEQGEGPAALFVHGVGTSGYLWRGVLPGVADMRRCIAFDLPGHGRSPIRPGEDISLPGLADLTAGFCDALGLDEVDLVANDTGGAIAQVFATRHPGRVRTLTLTNCDVHDNVPPEAFKPTVELAAAGELAHLGAALVADPALLRRAPALSDSFEHPESLSDEAVADYVEAFLRPVFGTPEAGREFERILTSLNAKDLIAIEPELARLAAPTLIVWAVDDIFMDLRWAYWLRDLIPGAGKVIEVPGRLFWPDQRPEELIPHLRRHWTS